MKSKTFEQWWQENWQKLYALGYKEAAHDSWHDGYRAGVEFARAFASIKVLNEPLIPPYSGAEFVPMSLNEKMQPLPAAMPWGNRGLSK